MGIDCSQIEYVVKKLHRPPARSCIYSVLSGYLADHINSKFCGVMKFYGFRLRFSVVTCINSSMNCTKEQNVLCGFRLINLLSAAIVFENFCCTEILFHFFDFLQNLFSDVIESSNNADPLLPQSFSKIY